MTYKNVACRIAFLTFLIFVLAFGSHVRVQAELACGKSTGYLSLLFLSHKYKHGRKAGTIILFNVANIINFFFTFTANTASNGHSNLRSRRDMNVNNASFDLFNIFGMVKKNDSTVTIRDKILEIVRNTTFSEDQICKAVRECNCKYSYVQLVHVF